MIPSTLTAFQKYNLGLKDAVTSPDTNILEEAAEQALKGHKRAVSRYDALKALFSEQMDEETAETLTKDILSDYHEDQSSIGSKFGLETTQFEEDEYIVLTNKDNDEAPLLVERKEIYTYDNLFPLSPSSPFTATTAANHEPTEKQLQQAIDRAFLEHSRKISQFESLEVSLENLLGEQTGYRATVEIMKSVHSMESNNKNDSLETGTYVYTYNIRIPYYTIYIYVCKRKMEAKTTRRKREQTVQPVDSSEVSNKKHNIELQVALLEKDVAFATEMVATMQLHIEDLRRQKVDLLIHTNHAIDQLRTALLACQSKSAK
ncbi:hypothetical protein RFI_09590 [Reticulomyxa filosa]|uniref:Uncharacterized protein n=1 Tax=Reticulomyxa filosa TaxID=46433 RepID=X6NNG9_RETFI|nr:hypothetical protein RFI_09590 [Reticulomyxa filosa]|eukprot:ETO27541.1 hypothetical protein RFI_09590 [Reticulomyxa filosa]